MRWLNYFSSARIPYYIYKINKNDCVVINFLLGVEHAIIILYGAIFLCKIFNNQEAFPVSIFNTNDVLFIKSLQINSQCYYKLISLDTTYILSFSLNDLRNNNKINHKLLFNIINSSKYTVRKYEIINHILINKYIKYRIIQLILFLCLEFGIIQNNKITIPFSVSQKNLAKITRSNTVAVNHIMNFLFKKQIIKYYSKKGICINNILNLISTFLL